jgi:hypothetical protein
MNLFLFRCNDAVKNIGTIMMAFVACLCLSGCVRNREAIEFCTVERGGFESESIVIDSTRHLIRGKDSASKYQDLDSTVAHGFVEPFPLVLPTLPLASMPRTWTAGGYSFSMSEKSELDPDWVIIQAVPLNQTDRDAPALSSSLLYSATKGVVAMRQFRQLDGHTVVGNFLFCGAGEMR